MKVVLLFALVTLGIQNQNPPKFPDRFSQKINETFKYGFISATTEAQIYYDWNSKRYRLDRKNGKWDRYCGTVYKFTDTACNQYVSEGMRYMHYPEKNYCCFCCDAAHGCGVLKPNWVDDASFKKEFEKDGVKYELWDKEGLQHNFVTIEKDSRRIVSID